MGSQGPARSAQGPSGRFAVPLAVALVALAACGGCGESRDTSAQQRETDKAIDISGTDAVGENLAGSVAALVECRDWNGASAAQRLATIADVRSQVSRRDAGISAPALTDAEAGRIFDRACGPAWAEGLRLYKVYAQAVSVAPLARALERQAASPGADHPAARRLPAQ